MLEAKAIDVLISLAFIYLLFSIAVSGLYEIYQSRYNRRGKFLRKVLDDVLNDPINGNFADEIYYHPLIDSVKENHKVFPSQLHPSHFSAALIDVLQHRAKGRKLEFNSDTKKYEVSEDLRYNALTPFEKLKAGIESLNNSPFKRIAETWLFDITETDNKNQAIEKVRKNIELWYNNYMDRTMGWFKRDLRGRMVKLGIIVSLVFNVNSIILVEFLWKEDAQRDMIVQTATDYVETQDSLNKLDTFSPTLNRDSILIKRHQETIKEAKEIIDDLNLPIGWEGFGDYYEDRKSVV